VSGKVLPFAPGVRSKRTHNSGTSTPPAKPKPPDRTTILLHDLAYQMDALLQRAVVHDELELEEVAAVVAHRLGTLMGISSQPHALREFCISIINRQSQGKSVDTDVV
jgi:hypothetical protein